MSTNFVFHPTEIHLQQIEDWLIAERNETGEGFYCNWNIIAASYEEKELCCITSNDEAIGFVAWERPSEFAAHLNIVEIRPDLRGRGFGKILVEECFNYFRNLDLLVVDLECQPPTSEPVWRRLGFRDLLNIKAKFSSNYTRSVNLYRPLVTSLEANNQGTTIEVLELWDKEPWEVQDSEPAWTWAILMREGTRKLVKPIIHPCDRNWRLRWRNGTKVFIDEKVKYFSEDSSSWGQYVFVTELPESPSTSLIED